VWRWETQNFVVIVNGNERSCYYIISSKSKTGETKPFADGTTSTFEQAELLIRETIGKAYKPILGYQHFAGPLATTFTIGNGDKVDLGEYSGHEVEVTVMNPDGTLSTYVGIASIRHYDFVITSQSLDTLISPTYIKTIEFAGRVNPVAVPSRLDLIMAGQVELGCTGNEGFIPGTVEHYGIACPVHEI
jgi:hypothetical protein